MSSRDYKGRRVVLWPVNIDANAPVSKGRKIPRSKAVPSPSVREIVQAAEELGLNPAVEEKGYPRSWWDQRVRVVVDKIGSKRKTLEAIAGAIRERRKRVRR